ncbi:hypothetical protein Hanom_Chr17g01569781 [Helianthus anomalus]
MFLYIILIQLQTLFSTYFEDDKRLKTKKKVTNKASNGVFLDTSFLSNLIKKC